MEVNSEHVRHVTVTLVDAVTKYETTASLVAYLLTREEIRLVALVNIN